MSSTDLILADTVHKQYPMSAKKGRPAMVKALWASGLFNHKDIHIITGASIALISKMLDVKYERNPLNETWEIKTLDAMVLVAVSYEDDEHISPVLIRRIVQWGTSDRIIARFTGVPRQLIREAIFAPR